MTETDHTGDRELCCRLRELRSEALPPGFQASLHDRLVRAAAPRPLSFWRRLRLPELTSSRTFWWASGVATAAALLLSATALRSREAPDVARSASVTVVPSTKVAVVRLTLAADVAVESADIRVTLPAELSFWGADGKLPQRSLAWSQPLRSGDNEISIPVRGQHPGRYRIGVTAKVGNEWVDDEVVLEVTSG